MAPSDQVDPELKLPSLMAVAKQGMFSILETREGAFRPTCGDNKVSRLPTLGFQGGVRFCRGSPQKRKP
ncbi:hypothetical protein VULLAG_LOCUS197 [Vulpes lagopus]